MPEKRINIEEFGKGMNQFLSPSKLQDDEPYLLENFELKQVGDISALVKRKPIIRYNTNQFGATGSALQTLFEYRRQANSTNYLIANNSNGASSKLQYITDSSGYTGTWTDVSGASGANEASRLEMCQIDDTVYIANRNDGAAVNKTWDSNKYQDMGCPIKWAALGLAGSNGAGSLTVDGIYKYGYTFLYEDKQESAMAGLFTIDLGATDDTVAITAIPTGNSRVTARKLYRSKANPTSSDSDMYYLTTILDNTTTTYTDLLADTVLIDAFDINLLMTPRTPYKAKYIAQHKSRSILGNLKENLYAAPSSGDFTITGVDSGGSMGSGIYKYRIYKINWTFDNLAQGIGDNVLFTIGDYYEATVNMSGFTGTDNSVDFTYSGEFNDHPAFLILRTAVGGSVFKTLNNFTSLFGLYYGDSTFTDTLADSGLIEGIKVTRIPNINYPNWIAISDAQRPDLFSTIQFNNVGSQLINTANLVEIEDSKVTGVFSEEDRLIVYGEKNIFQFNTSAIGSDFWKMTKIVNGIGADAQAQVQTLRGYVFITTSSYDKARLIIYEWDGRNDPIPCDLKIRDYIAKLNATGTVTIRDMAFNRITNTVHIVLVYTDDGATVRSFELSYDMDVRDELGLGRWGIKINATDLLLNCAFATQAYGLLYGTTNGYLHRTSPAPANNAYQDNCNGSSTNYRTKWQTKLFRYSDQNITPILYKIDVETDQTGITATAAVYYSFDGGTEQNTTLAINEAGTTTIPDGFSRLRTKLFTNFNTKYYKGGYFRFEENNNMSLKIMGGFIDLLTEYAGEGGD